MSAPDVSERVIRRLPVFPLLGALLFPGLQLPLHIFEPRYRAMVSKALSTDRLIGMIQPRHVAGPASVADAAHPPLFAIGCVGKIAEVEALDDGRYNLILAGVARFRVIEELTAETPYRSVEAKIEPEDRDEGVLAAVERAGLERAAKHYAQALGYIVDWEQVGALDDATLVNGIAQVAPFDAAAKQALLEADDLSERAELAIQLMQFFERRDGDSNVVTLQ